MQRGRDLFGQAAVPGFALGLMNNNAALLGGEVLTSCSTFEYCRYGAVCLQELVCVTLQQ